MQGEILYLEGEGLPSDLAGEWLALGPIPKGKRCMAVTFVSTRTSSKGKGGLRESIPHLKSDERWQFDSNEHYFTGSYDWQTALKAECASTPTELRARLHICERGGRAFRSRCVAMERAKRSGRRGRLSVRLEDTRLVQDGLNLIYSQQNILEGFNASRAAGSNYSDLDKTAMEGSLYSSC